MSRLMTSKSRPAVESLEGRKLMTVGTFVRLVNEAAVVERLVNPTDGHLTPREEMLVRQIESGANEAPVTKWQDTTLDSAGADTGSKWTAVKGLDLDGGANGAGTGSFTISAGSKMAAVIDLAIDEGVKSLDFEIGTVGKNGEPTFETLDVTFHSSTAETGPKSGEVDVVDFSFTHEQEVHKLKA